MHYGYSSGIVAANKAADGKLLGVKLGRFCIKHKKSVHEVSTKLKTSRQTLYNWFCGVSDPRAFHTRKAVEAYIMDLKH